MLTIDTLKKEILSLKLIVDDSLFDNTVLTDALNLIQIKNNQIKDLGGVPEEETIGRTKEDAIALIVKKMGVLERFLAKSPVAVKKYNLLDKLLKSKTGINFEEYSKGNKFLMGGNISGHSRAIVNNLIKTNEFVLLRESKNDNILKYTMPEDSILFQVLTPDINTVFALGYFTNDNFNLEFYEDEALNNSLNISHTFTKPNSFKDFKVEYIYLKKKLKDLDKKI